MVSILILFGLVLGNVLLLFLLLKFYFDDFPSFWDSFEAISSWEIHWLRTGSRFAEEPWGEVKAIAFIATVIAIAFAEYHYIIARYLLSDPRAWTYQAFDRFARFMMEWGQ